MKKTYQSKNKFKVVLTTIVAILLSALVVGGVIGLLKKVDKPDSGEQGYVQYEPAKVKYNATFGNDFETTYPISSLDLTDNMSAAPYAYQDNSLFAGKRITKIAAPVATVSAVDDNQYFTLWVIKAAQAGQAVDTSSAKSYKVYIPRKEISSTTVNKWITIDLSNQFIYVGKDEIIAFMKSDDTAICKYKQGAYGHPFFYTSNGKWQAQNSQTIFYSIWTDDVVSLASKNISILGDSISTYQGVSNDTSANTTIGNNAVFFPKADIDNVNETWWKQAIDSTGMNLLVNNSWSGSRVFNNAGAAYDTRATQLHADTGANKGKNPDIIAVYMGVNDFDNKVALGSFSKLSDVYDKESGYKAPQNFAEAYAIMLHKITQKYDKANVFVFTLPYNGANTDTKTMDSYNDTIRGIAKYFECQIVDLAKIEGYSYSKYTSDNLHPNEQGMDLITDLFVRTLSSAYAKKQ